MDANAEQGALAISREVTILMMRDIAETGVALTTTADIRKLTLME